MANDRDLENERRMHESNRARRLKNSGMGCMTLIVFAVAIVCVAAAVI